MSRTAGCRIKGSGTSLADSSDSDGERSLNSGPVFPAGTVSLMVPECTGSGGAGKAGAPPFGAVLAGGNCSFTMENSGWFKGTSGTFLSAASLDFSFFIWWCGMVMIAYRVNLSRRWW